MPKSKDSPQASPKTKKRSSQYARGRRKEWDFADRLRQQGMTVVRSAGSHGLWDLCAVDRFDVILIQVKYGSLREDANVALFRALAVPAKVKKWLVHYTKGVLHPTLENL